MKRLFVCFAIAILWAGCSTPDKAMQSYLGHHYADLVANWGQPQQTMPDGSGGQIWTYLQDRHWTTPGTAQTTVQGNTSSYGNAYGGNYYGNSSGYAQANTVYTPAQTRTWQVRRTFFINSDGVIYRYAWQGR